MKRQEQVCGHVGFKVPRFVLIRYIELDLLLLTISVLTISIDKMMG